MSPDDKVRAFVTEAYAIDAKLGELVDVLAVTGTRPSQAVRSRSMISAITRRRPC